jgi:hypothetical protein
MLLPELPGRLSESLQFELIETLLYSRIPPSEDQCTAVGWKQVETEPDTIHLSIEASPNPFLAGYRRSLSDATSSLATNRAAYLGSREASIKRPVSTMREPSSDRERLLAQIERETSFPHRVHRAWRDDFRIYIEQNQCGIQAI